MSPRTFCNVFPFHIIFDKQMCIRQCGTSIARLIPQMKEANCKLTDIFTIMRPHISLDFQSICSQIMSVFVLCTKNSLLASRSSVCGNSIGGAKKSSPTKQRKPDAVSDTKESYTRFKGQMVYLKDKELILFQCSPNVMSLEDMFM
jgi:guanylate cyclase soluble subunit beta